MFVSIQHLSLFPSFSFLWLLNLRAISKAKKQKTKENKQKTKEKNQIDKGSKNIKKRSKEI